MTFLLTNQKISKLYNFANMSLTNEGSQADPLIRVITRDNKVDHFHISNISNHYKEITCNRSLLQISPYFKAMLSKRWNGEGIRFVFIDVSVGF